MDKIVDVAEDIESTLVATEGEAIGRKYSKNKILKKVIGRRCWLCEQHEESIDHLTSGWCPSLAKKKTNT